MGVDEQAQLREASGPVVGRSSGRPRRVPCHVPGWVEGVEFVRGAVAVVVLAPWQSINVSLQSSSVTQSNSLAQNQVEEVERILGSVRAMLNPSVLGVTEEVTAEAQIVADEAEEEEEELRSRAPDSGKLKTLLFKLMELAATDTTKGGADALNSMMQQGVART